MPFSSLIYLQTILKRDRDEVTRCVYEAQKQDPHKGDFVKLVQEDALMINYIIDETKYKEEAK